MVKYYVNDYIRNCELKDYGKGGPPSNPDIDCSLGVNPEPIPQVVIDKFHQIDEATLKHYPHDEEILTAIAAYYRDKSKELSWLTEKHIFIGDGTTDILYCLNVLYLQYQARVLGHAPQFTAYIDQVNCLGAIYDSYKMTLDQNYKFDVEGYINQMNQTQSLFIVEKVNNPTGQVVNLYDIEKIADRARSKNKILIVDEAYGDYLPIENSAINLVPNYPNVVVTRTFSKGFGLAGIRMGYLITSNEEVTDNLTQFKKIENQFTCNGIARSLGIALLESGLVIPDLTQISDDKKRVMEAIKKMTIATTAPTTPIMTLYYNTSNPDFNLQTFLFDTARLWTVSCATYDQFDKRAVRLMLPKHTDIDKLIGMLKKAEDNLPSL
jgi:histidinol-phosphate aminotransferase